MNYISEYAFKDTNIEAMTIKTVVPPELNPNGMGPDTWYFDRALPVTIPCGTLEDYQDAEGWNEFTNMQEGITDSFSVFPADENAGTVTVLKEASCKDGSVKVMARPSYGYEFLYWEANGIQVSSENPYIFELEEDTELVAFFSSNGMNETGQLFSAYPNPVVDHIKIEGACIAEVQVYNTKSQLMRTIKSSNEINMKGLPKGIYALRVLDDNGNCASFKVVKE